MDPITLIVTALRAGAASVTSDVASSALRDAYTTQRDLLSTRFAGRPDGELVLSKYEGAPATWPAPLAAELARIGADRDADLVAAARAVMSLVDPAGAHAGKYTVELPNTHDIQIGDANGQDNLFDESGDGAFGVEHWDG
jgi:hypothetical protein